MTVGGYRHERCCVEGGTELYVDCGIPQWSLVGEVVARREFRVGLGGLIAMSLAVALVAMGFAGGTAQGDVVCHDDFGQWN